MPTPSESGPTSNLQKSGINDIDAFFFEGLYIVKFGTGYSPLNLTYSFPSAQSSWAEDYAFSSQITNEGGFKQFSDAQQIAARKAISAWGEISNLRPTEIYETSVLVGDIRIAFANLPNNLAGIANNPQRGPNGGDVWISNNYSDKSFSLGSFEYILILHELGHALGLKHPRDHTPVLPSTLDNHQFSIMSLTNSSNYNGIVFPQTPMIYDIQAIQYIYGANMNTRTEDNIYSFSPSKFEAMSIWDAGGQDTLSASNQNSNSLIDLREGRYSSIGLKNNIGIAFGVTIENAIGSIKNDIIIGNDTNNFIDGGAGNDALDGGAGNDSLYGGDGDDTLDGGEGADYLSGGDGDDKFYYTNGSDEIWGGKGEDSLILSVAISELKDIEYNGLDVSFSVKDSNVVTRGIENYYFENEKYVLDNNVFVKPISITSENTQYDEGSIVHFEVSNLSKDSISEVRYTLSGISESDLESGALTGAVLVSELGSAIISVPLAADFLTEGAETLFITLDDFPDKTASVVVSDTSMSLRVNEEVTGSIAIIGALEEKKTLTADTSSLADEDGLGTFNYQWLRDGSAIAGATGSTYTTTASDIYRFLTVTISYTDGYGTVETVTSESSDAIANVIPIILSTTHLTSILVDEGVLGALPSILEGLTENIEKTDGVTTSHVFSFNGSNYDYDDISPFIMIVVRDNEFTDDFRSELADFAPEYKNLTYQDAIDAVGLVGISAAIITVAGADGNYIG